MVHKSNAVESIINCNTKTSTDIWFRVFGPRDFSRSSDNSNNSLNLIRISDTLLYIAKSYKKELGDK